jgi:hypothetical protein
MLFTLRTFRLPRKRPWKCLRGLKMRLNRLLEKVFPRLFLQELLMRRQSNLVQAEDSLVVLLMKLRNLKLAIEKRK